ncbi:ATP-binding protein [Endozoicomonadaceae bacterium StTr2]
MSFDVSSLTLLTFGYLSLLFFIAWSTDKGWIPRKVATHPATYILSLGVYASAWAFYGMVGMAYQYGYVFLSYYLGVSGAFLLAPVLLSPLLRITRNWQLRSLADIFAFRFRSSWAGALTTIFLLVSLLPLLALQIQAVSDSIHILDPDTAAPEHFAFGFCLLMVLFASLFGTRHMPDRQKHHGLVTAVAFESLVKLTTLLIIGGVVLFGVFDGLGGLNEWLAQNPQVLGRMQAKLKDGPWRSLLLMFFAAAIVMPHLFHMLFTENIKPAFLNTASWAVPLLLLLMSLAVPLILWGGQALNADTAPEFYTLGVGLALDNPALIALSFLGGVSAASGVTIVCTLALSSMVLNHLILPVYQPSKKVNIYRWLQWTSRVLVAVLIIANYAFYYLMQSGEEDLTDLAILSYAAGMQFLPGVLAVLYWPQTNRQGFISGLLAGLTVWALTLMYPVLTNSPGLFFSWHGLNMSLDSNWYYAALASITLNGLVMIVVSRLTTQSTEEAMAAEACAVEQMTLTKHRTPAAGSVEQFEQALSAPLGVITANREMTRALQDLQMSPTETRPYALRRLRDQLEANLSGLMGPSVARDIITRALPWQTEEQFQTADINFIESRLETYQTELTGLAAQLDQLRRYHREILNQLPMAVCSLGPRGEILMWNQAMTDTTGILPDDANGLLISELPQPWSRMLIAFTNANSKHEHNQHITQGGKHLWFNLHKTIIKDRDGDKGYIIMLEDLTEAQSLEQRLEHSERLASIGQLAAGVAHEIGNPVTAISCLAQEMKALSSEQDVKFVASQMLEQTQRISTILRSLMNFAHSGSAANFGKEEPVDMHAVIHEAIALLSLSPKHHNLQFSNQCDSDVCVLGDAQKLLQIFINLLSNAADASPESGEISITSRLSEQSVDIAVTDAGHGISKENQSRLFEPFFTTKEPGKGTGLGLALVHRMVEEHFGSIRVESPVDTEAGTGTRFTVRLPRYVTE